MRTLYIECSMGVAGDMLTAALYELLPDKAAFLEKMNGLNLHGVHMHADTVRKSGIAGTHISVHVHGEEEHSHDHHEGEHHHHHHSHSHHHYSLKDVQDIISGLDIPAEVKDKAFGVYDAIAKAESRAHGTEVEMVHFHEVGAMDAIADVVGACYALHLIAPEKVIVSPVRTGYGQVHCAHGIMPVPAPATAYLLEGVPSYAGDIKGEMCTPTGAALIKTFADSFGEKPLMAVSAIGYGMGTKDFGAANCVRTFLGETEEHNDDTVIELACNIDDMTAEALAYAMERIMDAGALDVSAVPATMKKGRAGHILYVMAKPETAEDIAKAILQHTRTNGVRMHECRRMKLSYEFKTAKTSYGDVRMKCAEGYGVNRSKPEYEDVARLAKENNVPFYKVWEEAIKNS